MDKGLKSALQKIFEHIDNLPEEELIQIKTIDSFYMVKMIGVERETA